MPIELFVFDIAGTTVRDDGFVTKAFHAAADTIGFAADDEWVRARMGLDKRQVFREMLRLQGSDESLVGTLIWAFESAIDREVETSRPHALPGATESIHLLTQSGVRVAFTSGFSERTARSIIDRTPWASCPVVGSDAVAHGRPAPDLIREAMRRSNVDDAAAVGVAGDTPSDLQAGNAACCAMIVGVGHGSHTLAELASHPHTHLMADLSSLAEVVRGEV